MGAEMDLGAEDAEAVRLWALKNKKNQRFVYGLPTDEIQRISPILRDRSEFLYPLDFLSRDDMPAAEALHPNESTIQAPPLLYFPRASTFTRSERDCRYRRGYVYERDMTLTEDSKRAEAAQLLKVAMPPGIHPLGYDYSSQSFIRGPVEGMIEMTPGVPFVINIDGNKDKRITVGCMQTLTSLRSYPEFPMITKLWTEVTEIIWGTKDREPMYRMDGTKLNARSGPEKEHCYDGSVSLGITVEEVGAGYVQPAVQASTTEAQNIQLQLVTRVAALYRLIMPLCVSKMEWDVVIARAIDVNAICCGGLDSGFSSIQRNVSSSWKGGSLASSLELESGAFHVDPKDCINRHTMLLGSLRLPPGSSGGDFILARLGLYGRIHVDKYGYASLFLVMKGNDVHSGTSPTVLEARIKPFFEELRHNHRYVGIENRVFLVAYPNALAMQRTGSVSMTKPTGFEYVKAHHTAHSIASDGFPACGTFQDWQTLLARERYMKAYNLSRMMNDEPSRELPSFITPSGARIYVRMPFDPETDAEQVDFIRGAFLQHSLQCAVYNLHMTRPIFQKHHKDVFQQAQDRYQDFRPEFPSSGAQAILASESAHPDNTPSKTTESPTTLTVLRHSAREKAATTNSASKALRVIKPIPSPTPKEVQDRRLSTPDQQAGAVEDGELFEIAFIKQHRYNSILKEFEFAVRWKDYGKKDDSWVLELDMQASDLLRKYKASRKLAGPIADISYPLKADNSRAYRALTKLLDLDRMSGEYRDVTNSVRQLDGGTFAEVNHIVESTTSWDECFQEWSLDSPLLRGENLLVHITTASQTIFRATALASAFDIASRSLSLSICRSLRFVYLFETLWGPALFKSVLELHHNSHGIGMVIQWPKLAALIKAVYDRVFDEHNQRKLAKTGRIKRNSPALAWTVPTECLEALGVTSPAPLTLDAINRKTSLKSVEECLTFAQEQSLYIFIRAVICPHLLPFDQHINQYRDKAVFDSPGVVNDRCVIRGALLDAFVDWLDDDDLFASGPILELIASPMLLLGGNVGDAVGARKLLKGEPIFACVGSWLLETQEVADVKEVSSMLHSAVQAGITKLSATRRACGHYTGRLQKSPKAILSLLFDGIDRVPSDTPLSSLLPYNDGLRIDMLAFMIREALNKQTGEELQGENSLNRLIHGLDPLTNVNSSSRDPDHYDPIRATNDFQKLVNSYCADRDLLSDEFTLSNILVILGTGQGYRTKAFFNRYLLGCWFKSPQECTAVFQMAYSVNRDVVLDNMRCWGTPCSWLGFERDPEGVPKFSERLEDMFSQTVLELWHAFGEKDRRSYEDAFNLAKETGIVGFGSGITQMQFANTLALLGICDLPDCDAMAKIIRANKRMGAFEGLQRLGLQVDASSSASDVQAAFRCVYDALDHLLLDRHKTVLHFNAIFVEHLLCKVSRWEKMFPKKTYRTLRRMAAEARDGNEGLVFHNDSDPKSFPFPLQLDRAHLFKWIQETRPRIGAL